MLARRIVKHLDVIENVLPCSVARQVGQAFFKSENRLTMTPWSKMADVGQKEPDMNIHGHTGDVVEQSADRLITFSGARKFVGLSRSKIYLLMAASEFPAPVKIGRNNYFSMRELQAWINARLVARKLDNAAINTSLGIRSQSAGE